MQLNIGVLSIIGSFAEHEVSLKNAFEAGLKENKWKDVNLNVIRIISKDQLNESLDGLIIPGGETTVISTFLKRGDFFDVLKSWINLPNKFTWGTCAGMILLSDTVLGGKNVTNVGGIGIVCKRNAYGRQNDSSTRDFEIVENDIKNVLSNASHNNIFSSTLIRAPAISSIESVNVKILSEAVADHNDGLHKANAVQQGNKMGSSFHPELTNELRWHAYFINQVIYRKMNKTYS